MRPFHVTPRAMDAPSNCSQIVSINRLNGALEGARHQQFTALILRYADNGQEESALKLFAHHRPSHYAPNSFSFVAALKACANLAVRKKKSTHKRCVLERARCIHYEAANAGCDAHLYVSSLLVDMYGKCGDMSSARKVFDMMRHRSVVSWTSLILGYAENREEIHALEMFQRMRSQGCEPNARTFVAALKACSLLAARDQDADGKLVSLEAGQAIHSEAVKRGYGADSYVASTLVGMYTRCGTMCQAQSVFDGMKSPNVMAWTTLMFGYAECGQGERALELLEQMIRSGCSPDALAYVAALKACSSLAEKKECDKQQRARASLRRVSDIHSRATKQGYAEDVYVASTLVDVYGKCGSMEDARRVFDRMQERDTVTWTALISGYADNGEAETALRLYRRMQPEGCVPDEGTFVAILKVCSMLASLEAGRSVHSDIAACEVCGCSTLVANSLIDFYGRCGSMQEALQVFNSLPNKDVVTWNVLMSGYSRQGNVSCVVELFHRMRDAGFRADRVTFLCILAACSHAGLTRTGREYFDAMTVKYGVEPGIEHYHCMIDILGRANELEQAIALARSMPFEAEAVTWRTVLSACHKWKNMEIGRVAFELLMRIDDKDALAIVLMTDIYRSSG